MTVNNDSIELKSLLVYHARDPDPTTEVAQRALAQQAPAESSGGFGKWMRRQGLNIATWLCVRSCSSLEKNPDYIYLSALSKDLPKLLRSQAPAIMEKLPETLLADYPAFQEYCQKEETFVLHHIEATLLKAFANCLKQQIKDPKKATEALVSQAVIDTLSAFAFQALEQHLDPEKFTKLNKDVFAIALPNGANEIPVRYPINTYIYQALVESLPQQIVRLHKKPQFKALTEALQEEQTPSLFTEIGQKLAKSLRSALQNTCKNPADDMNDYLKACFQRVGNAEEPYVEELWDFLERVIAHATPRGLAHAGSDLPTIATCFMQAAHKFFQQTDIAEENRQIRDDFSTMLYLHFHDEVNPQQFEEQLGMLKRNSPEQMLITLKKGKKTPSLTDQFYLQRIKEFQEREAALAAKFRPLSHELLEMTNLQTFFWEIWQGIENEELPKVLLDLYRDFTGGVFHQEQHQDVVAELMLSPEEKAAEEDLKEVYRKRKKGEIEKIQQGLAYDVRGFVQNNWETLGKALLDSEEYAKQLGKDLKTLSESKDDSVIAFFKFLEDSMGVALFKVLAAVASQEECANPEDLLANTARVLANKIEKAFPDMSAHKVQQECAKGKEASKEVKAQFRKLAEELLALTKEEDALLPLPTYLRKPIWHALKTDLFPNYLMHAYAKASAWNLEKAGLKDALFDHYKTTHVSEFARVLSHFTKEWVLRSYLQQNEESVGKKLFENIPLPLDRIEKNQEVQQFLAQNVKTCAKQTDPRLDQHLQEYIEASLLKVFESLTTLMSNTEKTNPNFLLNLVKDGVKESKEHFMRINEIQKKQFKGQNVWDIKHEEMQQAFGDKLHKGMGENAFKEFFTPLSEKILSLAGITAEDLPIPKEFQKTLYTTLTTSLMPAILQYLFDQIADPSTLTKVATQGVMKANEVYDTVMQKELQHYLRAFQTVLKTRQEKDNGGQLSELMRWEETFRVVKKEADPRLFSYLHILQGELQILRKNPDDAEAKERLETKYYELNETMTTWLTPDSERVVDKQLNHDSFRLVKEFVKTIPHTITKPLLGIPAIEKMTKEAVGGALSDNVLKNTLLEFINKGAYNGVFALCDGEWQEEGKERLFDVINKFIFPVTVKEKAEDEAKRDQADKAYQKAFEKAFIEQFHTRVNSSVKSTFVNPWTRIKRTTEARIKKSFGKKINLDHVLLPLEAIAWIVTQILVQTLGRIFWFLMDQLHLKWRAREALKSFTMEIHKNLLFILCDLLIKKLEEEKKRLSPQL